MLQSGLMSLLLGFGCIARTIANISTHLLNTTKYAQAAGLIGCFRFLEGFYLLLVTQRRYHGTVCGKNT